jgi:hypothetical protein
VSFKVKTSELKISDLQISELEILKVKGNDYGVGFMLVLKIFQQFDPA